MYDQIAFCMTAIGGESSTASCLVGTEINTATITDIMRTTVRDYVLPMQQSFICGTFVSQEAIKI